MKAFLSVPPLMISLLLAVVSEASTLTYIGTQPDLGSGWRTPTLGKPFDPDGDLVIGTDGYHLVNRPPVWPSYLASTEILGGTFAGNAGYASIDDPTALPAVFRTGTMNPQPGSGVSADLFRFTLGATAVGRTIRVGLLVDNLDDAVFNSASFTLVQTNGSGAISGPVSTALAPFDNRTPDWIFFEITAGVEGDVFLVRGTGGVAGAATLGGVSFDSVTTIAPVANFTLQAQIPAVDVANLSNAATSGDTVVVGNLGLGKAFIYVRDGTTWSLQAELTGQNTEAGDLFGSFVAIYGDTVIVGARGEASAVNGITNPLSTDNSAPGMGAAYVFVRTGTTWTQQAYLKAGDTAGNNFGSVVTLFGNTAVVGTVHAQRARTSLQSLPSGPRAAYVFVRNGTNWTQQARLTPLLQDGDGFGHSLGLFEDTLAVGSPGQNGAAGGVIVFTRQGSSWSETANLAITTSAVVGGDYFGHSVSISGNTIVAGAPGEDSLGASDNELGEATGAAYVFVRSGTNWTQQAFLKVPEATSNVNWGRTAGIAGDTVVLGSHFSTAVFQRSGTNWVRQAGLGGFTNIIGQGTPLGASISGGTALVCGREELRIYSSASPRLVVEDARGFILPYGGSSREMAIQDGQAHDLTFTLRNTGTAALNNVAINFSGPDAARFTIPTPPASTVTSGGSTTFIVRFPSGGGSYPAVATLQIAGSDASQLTYPILLTGYNLLSTFDSDADGLHDVAEFRLNGLGFNHLVKQTEMVNSLNQGGLYGPGQLQALALGRPLLTQTAPGQFKLTVGLQKATQLTDFGPLPMAVSQTTINAQGELEFQFTSPDKAAFYRLEAR